MRLRHWTMVDPVDELPPLRALIGHREFVRATDSLETVHLRFSAGKHDFMAVVAERKLLGLCSRRAIGTLLGARYGFALFARAAVSAHLVSDEIRVSVTTPLTQVLEAVAKRRDEHFYDDILLVDEAGQLLGLIFVRELVRVQHTLLLGHITELERRQEEIARRNRQMEEDLRMARQVQVALLPTDFPTCRGAGGRILRFAQVFQPADGVSGDFFAVFPVSTHTAGLLMCDVMGHGVRSALVTAMVRSMVEDLQNLAAQPGEFLTKLNVNLTRLLSRLGVTIFVTASYVTVDAALGRLRFAHAGHPFPIRWSSRDGRAEPIKDAGRIGGPALGLMDDHVYETADLMLEEGDRVMLITDGIEEAANPAGEEFGMSAICREFANAVTLPLDAALDRLRQQASSHAGSTGFSDDVCLLACELTRVQREQGGEGSTSPLAK